MQGANQEISSCFLQDLQTEWEREQMQKSYKGVKLQQWCEGITVSRRTRRVVAALWLVSTPRHPDLYVGESTKLH